MNDLELKALWWIREHLTNPFLDRVMPPISSLANHGEFWILLALILVCFRKTRKAGVAMGIAMACGYLIGNMGMKNLFARPRPYTLTNVSLLVDKLHDFAFPSGHTLVSFEAATALAVYHRRWGIAALVLAAIIGYSRLYLFVHYPTDVVAGASLGIGIALLACWCTNRLWTKKA